MGRLNQMTFEKLDEEYLKSKKNIRDIKNSNKHFERWHRAKGLPELDPDGKAKGSSQIFYQQYQADPEGEAARPLYVDMWHFFVSVVEKFFEWKEDEHENRKATIVLCDAIIAPYERVRTPEEYQKANQLWRDGGQDESFIKEYEESIRTSEKAYHAQATEARKILEKYGSETEINGQLVKALVLHLTV